MNNIETEQKNENEFWIGANKTVFNGKNIIYFTMVGEQTAEIANLTKELHLRLFKLIDGEVKILIDLNRCGKNSPVARITWNELCEHDKTKKVAFFGLNPVARLIAMFVISFSSKKNQRFFKTEEDARAWLAE